MMAYLLRYISNFSSRCEPLRRLTKKDHSLEWTEAQQMAFEDLTTAITTASVLILYKPGRETMVTCDGCPTGLGGGIAKDRTWLPASTLCQQIINRHRETVLPNRTRSIGCRVHHFQATHVITRSTALSASN